MKQALQLHYAGNDVDEILESLSDVGEAKDSSIAKNKLSEYVESVVKTSFKIYNFLNTKQQANESIDSSCTWL